MSISVESDFGLRVPAEIQFAQNLSFLNMILPDSVFAHGKQRIQCRRREGKDFVAGRANDQHGAEAWYDNNRLAA